MKTISLGEALYPEGFEETLRGLGIEEQMNRFRTTYNDNLRLTPWRELRQGSRARKLDEDDDVTAVVVSEGKIAGVMMKNWCDGETFCRPGGCVCTYCASDNNGAGYKEREDYNYLICVSEDFDAPDAESKA